MSKKLYRYWAAVFSISALVVLVIVFQLRTLHAVQMQEYEDLAQRIMHDGERLSAFISNEILSIPLYFNIPLANSASDDEVVFTHGYASFIETAPYPTILGEIYYFSKTDSKQYTVYSFDKKSRQFINITGNNPFQVSRLVDFVLSEKSIRIAMPDPEKIFLIWPFSSIGVFVLTIPLEYVELELLAKSAGEYIQTPSMYDYSLINRSGVLLYTSGKVTPENMRKPYMLLNLNLFGPPFPVDTMMPEPMRMPSIPRQGMNSTPNYLRELRRQQSAIDTRNYPPFMVRDTGWKIVITSKYSPFITLITAPSSINLVLTICIIALLSIALIYGIHSNRKYSEVSQQQRLFLNSITHELRTPIASLLGAADNMESGLVQSTEDIREYGQLINEEAKRLRTIIDSVLLFSGISSRQTALEMMDILVSSLFSAAFTKFETVFKTSNFFIETIFESASLKVHGNKALLETMLENIFRNVQVHASSGKFLGYGAYTTKRNNTAYTALWIRDKGKGIAKSEQKRIFMPFFRGKLTIEKQIQGTGIGLYITSRIVELHRGIILCESKPGLGTTFTIMLPVLSERIGQEGTTRDS